MKQIINKKKAFTLVELIVVITILAILWTIAFISLQGYSRNARDSVRISDISRLETSLEFYSLKTWTYPAPTWWLPVTYTGSEVWLQGTIWESVITNLGKMSKKPVDPLTGTEYTYSRLNTEKEFEIGTILEWDLASWNIPSSMSQTHAAWEQFYSYVQWTYNWVVAKVTTGPTTYVLAVPTIIATEVWDLLEIIRDQKLAFKGSFNTPSSYKWTNGYTASGSFDYNSTNSWAIVVYEWSIAELKIDTNLQSLGNNLISAYSGTDISNQWVYSQIISMDSGDITQLKSITGNIANNSLGAKVNLNDSTQCINTTTPTNETLFLFEPSTKTITAYLWFSSDIIIPCNINWIAVENISDYTFSTMSDGLTTILIPKSLINIWQSISDMNWLISVTNYDWMLSNEYVYSPEWNWIKIVKYFWSETNLTIPNTMNWKNVIGIGAKAFKNKNLTNVIIPSSVSIIGDYTFSWNNLTTLTIPSNISSIWANIISGNASFGNVMNYDWISSADYIYSPSWSWIEIDTYIWSDTTLAIPSTINWKQVVSMWESSFFSKALSSVTIPNNVVNIWISAFSNNNLSSILLPDNLISIWDDAFVWSNLITVTIPNTINAIWKRAFGNSLDNIINYDGISSTDYIYSPVAWGIEIDEYFWPNTALNIPDTINWKQVVSIWESASSTLITSLIMPNTVTRIWESAFRTQSLTTVTLSNNLTTIPTFAFYLTQLTSVTIPSSVTSIGSMAFGYNYLTSVIITDSVTNIGWGAFSHQYWWWGWTVYWPAWYVKDIYDNTSSFDNVKLPTYVIQP